MEIKRLFQEINNISANERAEKIAKSLLERSDLPKSLYSNVKRMIDPCDFIEDGQLDQNQYEDALRNEIIDWETKLYGYSNVKKVEMEGNEEEDIALGRRLVREMFPDKI